MRSIADRVRRNRGSDEQQVNQLLEELKKEGLFAPGSLSDSTRTASELFQVRDGNCLSFTSLFVAMGRHAGLTVGFQLVDVPPEFDAVDGVLVHQTHINATVKVDSNETRERSITVDFNETNAAGYRRRLVSDDYAYALYRSNIAIELWRNGVDEEAFANLKTAIELEPGIADLWSNLGAMYLKAQHPETAAEAYSIALSIDPHNTTALNGLAAHYSSLGQEWRSSQLSRLSRAQRKDNPYYYFAQAQRAFAENRSTQSLGLLSTAVQLKSDDHRFYGLRAAIYLQLGDIKRARESLNMARAVATHEWDKASYLRALDAITE